ncbi:MAG: hypothetical protein RR739_10630 [Clostridia bacterium]
MTAYEGPYRFQCVDAYPGDKATRGMMRRYRRLEGMGAIVIRRVEIEKGRGGMTVYYGARVVHDVLREMLDGLTPEPEEEATP